MKLKKLLSLFLILALCVGLTACSADVTVEPQTTASTTIAADATSTAAADTTADGGNASATAVTDGIDTTAPPTSTTAGRVTTTKAPVLTTTAATTTVAATTAPTTASAADKALVDRAFALAQGAAIENVTLSGVVTSSQGYSSGYNNATFHIQVEGTSGTKTIYCYRVKPADSARTAVDVGDVVSLSGTIQNYKGTIEFYPATYTHLSDGPAPTTTARPTAGGDAAIDEDGIYDSKQEVALYIHTYGKLPKNYVTKSQYNKDKYLCVGGDRFYNKEGLLPSGETYYECDIDTYGITSRGAKRLVWTKSGIVYYTADHYESFVQLYGERE